MDDWDRITENVQRMYRTEQLKKQLNMHVRSRDKALAGRTLSEAMGAGDMSARLAMLDAEEIGKIRKELMDLEYPE